ncbi:hypothetical protein Rin_00010710 [Candidatus Regiella insecticola 5.15]|uniref:P pilus assembly protein, pilin FimA n=1 Tax=Candidatus Regiella insecticola 5.15 TaxID=1005043 RepID=G2GZ56_9ENTR|nr:fimbrial protein [Candidatus Regiella insecticola]EGY28973.1 hypothetical protein Rin_00010710 [Candidatus Regiella insecticola 5.15]
MFLKKKVALLASMLVLNSWAGSVLAGESSTTLTVQASLKPTSCDVTLTKPDLDFGVVRQGETKTESTDLQINCSNKTLVSVSVKDNNYEAEHNTTDNQFVLVDTDKKRQGSFSFKLGQLAMENDENEAAFITSADGKTDSNTWSRVSEGYYLNHADSNAQNKFLSVGNSKGKALNQLAPSAYKNYTFPLIVELTMGENALTTGDKLLGNATFDVTYI